MIMFQYQYHAKNDTQIEACLNTMSTGMTTRLSAILEATLAKIARFDEGRWGIYDLRWAFNVRRGYRKGTL